MVKLTKELKVYVSLPYASAPLDAGTPFSFYTTDMSEYGCPVVDEVTVSVPFNLPSKEEMVLRQVAALRRQQTKKRAEAEREDHALQDEINKLLALTYEAPEMPAASPETVANSWQDIIHGEHWVCCKTGCAFTLTNSDGDGDHLWGDLFEDRITGRLLFNCADDTPSRSVTDPTSEYLVQVDENAEGLDTVYRGFERLIVVPKADAVLSEALVAYIDA